MMSRGNDPTYPLGPDGLEQLAEFWKGARDSTREEMRKRFKAGEFYDLHDGLMKDLMDAYDPNGSK